MEPCKHLNYEEDKVDLRFNKLCELPEYPIVKYWERRDIISETVYPVQYCRLRGRVKGIFQCYNEGELSCHESG